MSRRKSNARRGKRFGEWDREFARGGRARDKGRDRFGSNPFNRNTNSHMWAAYDSGWQNRDEQLSTEVQQ